MSILYQSLVPYMQFDSSTGVLSVNGIGTAELYSQLLNNITYHNKYVDTCYMVKLI